VPSGLACLARYYVGTPDLHEGRWQLVLPSGVRLDYDDGRKKDFEQRLNQPDLQDTFFVRYPTGDITPIVDPQHDPGRVRVDALFRETYGNTQQAVQKQLVQVVMAGQSLPVHPKAADAFRAVSELLDALLKAHPEYAVFLKGLAGTFNWRNIAGTQRLSAHSFGVSVDLNTEKSDYWRWAGKNAKWRNRIPAPIVHAFEAEGFVWGGRWAHFDTMHFEYRRELLDPSCWAVP